MCLVYCVQQSILENVVIIVIEQVAEQFLARGFETHC